MRITQLLSSIDWPKYQTLYAIAFEYQDIKDVVVWGNGDCNTIYSISSTRCLFSTDMCGYLLNPIDKWREIDLSLLMNRNTLNTIKAINIEIDVTSRLDHMFILFNSDNQWYILQSYVNQYEVSITPIDIERFISVVQRWRISGVNPSEWRHYFGANIPSANKAVTHVFVVDRIFPDKIVYGINTIRKRIQQLLNDRNSYVQNSVYRCLINKCLS